MHAYAGTFLRIDSRAAFPPASETPLSLFQCELSLPSTSVSRRAFGVQVLGVLDLRVLVLEEVLCFRRLAILSARLREKEAKEKQRLNRTFLSGASKAVKFVLNCCVVQSSLRLNYGLLVDGSVKLFEFPCERVASQRPPSRSSRYLYRVSTSINQIVPNVVVYSSQNI